MPAGEATGVPMTTNQTMASLRCTKKALEKEAERDLALEERAFVPQGLTPMALPQALLVVSHILGT